MKELWSMTGPTVEGYVIKVTCSPVECERPAPRKAISMDDSSSLREELHLTEKLLGERERVLDAIPHCPEHGACVPYALKWIKEAKRREGSSEAEEPVSEPTEPDPLAHLADLESLIEPFDHATKRRLIDWLQEKFRFDR